MHFENQDHKHPRRRQNPTKKISPPWNAARPLLITSPGRIEGDERNSTARKRPEVPASRRHNKRKSDNSNNTFSNYTTEAATLTILISFQSLVSTSLPLLSASARSSNRDD